MSAGHLVTQDASKPARKLFLEHYQWEAAWHRVQEFEKDGSSSASDFTTPGRSHNQDDDFGFSDDLDDGDEGYIETFALFVIGEPGTGKTWLLNAFHRQPHLRRKDGKYGDIRPVVRINVPDAPTPKAIVTEITTKLGTTVPERWTRNAVAQYLRELFADLETRFILMDEAHVLVEDLTRAKVRTLARFIKFMLVDCRVPIILAGEPPLEELLEHKALGRRTYAPARLRSYRWGVQEEVEEFAVVVGRVAERAGWKNYDDFHEMDLAARCFYASRGVIGILVKLVREATHYARSKGARHLRAEHFAEIHDRWHPFVPEISSDPFKFISMSAGRSAANPFTCEIDELKLLWLKRFGTGDEELDDRANRTRRRKALKEKSTALKAFGR